MPYQTVCISYGFLDSSSFARTLGERLLQEDITVGEHAIRTGITSDVTASASHSKHEKEDKVGKELTDAEQSLITQSITNADHLVFVISPDGVNSSHCAHALAIALAFQKRIIPLMHIEQHTYDVWKNRYPKGTYEDWQEYQDKGFHASLANMHPALSRMEWLFFREDAEDDFGTSFQTLLNILRCQQEYAHQHTLFLDKALKWDQGDRKDQNLLDSSELQAATDWLQVSTDNIPHPCHPTELQREFITASLQQLSAERSEVFLCYSADDTRIARQLQAGLVEAGFNLWNSPDRIVQGIAVSPEEIYEAIEQTDTIVYLLSSHALGSKRCQQQLAHGQSLNKQTIVIILEKLGGASLPESLVSYPSIDCTQRSATAIPKNVIHQLSEALQDNAQYYSQHKHFLVRALQWDRLRQPTEELLRGKDYVDAVAWLETGKQTSTQVLPTRLHERFIMASQEVNRFFDGFISYGRPDSLSFATRLYDYLVDLGFNVWFDKMAIPPAVDFQTQINDGIERSHNFIFIISPHSAHSPYCLKEIELALQLNKRIIPLMHVEEIDQTTWQQRHSNSLPEEWETYKSQGKHTSYGHIHPEIGKINWIFCRETVDPLEPAFVSLVKLLRHQESYIHRHTELMTKALAWKRHQYSQNYLLTGVARNEAETWLSHEFKDEQAPCIPTVLHCEFITESSKFANNSMAQVFLCFAEEDTEIKELIRKTLDLHNRSQSSSHVHEQTLDHAPHWYVYRILIRAGFTVWTYSDIQMGEKTQDAIDRGIEGSDTFLFLLTPYSIQSEHCLRELNYALMLNKRIIPLMVQSLPTRGIPSALQTLQLIDFTDQNPESLLKALRQDSAYYRIHKQLLTVALKWDRQQRNPAILFRRNTLRQYATWMTMAQQRSQHPPVPIQSTFIATSEEQVPDTTLDVFIVYAPEDFEFARKLNSTLQIQGQTTWFEENMLMSAIEDQQQVDPSDINQAIEQAENVLFILSPNAVNESSCLEQLNYAVQLNKRIVPVLYQEVFGRTHAALNQIPWIDFSGSDTDFLEKFGDLYRVLASDPTHIQPHTRLMVKAREWEQAGRDDSYLLRGQDLREAETWLQLAVDKTPRPTPLQKEYIHASHDRPLRKVGIGAIARASILFTIITFALNLLVDMPLTFSLYDLMMRRRPSEPQDERFLLVTVSESAGSWLRDQMIANRYRPSISTIPDEALRDTLSILNAHSPRMIVLDFYRDFPAEEVLKSQLSQTPNLIGICKARYEEIDGVAKAPELAVEQVGFNDFLDDDDKRTIRRQPLMQAPDPDFCDTRESLSLKMARLYLEAEGVSFTSPLDEGSKGNVYQKNGMALGETVIPQLRTQSGLYKDPERLAGYQALLNFRTFRGDPEHFAPTLSLEEILQENFDPQDIQDRIVVILYTDKTDRSADSWNTPYGDIPGGILHAQMASQLISAALDNRSLIKWWPMAMELGWILIWAMTGGFIFWQFSRPRYLISATITTVVVLYGCCAILLVVWSTWVPLVAPAIALLLTGTRVAYLNHRLRNP